MPSSLTAGPTPLGLDYPPTAIASPVEGTAGPSAVVRSMPAPTTRKKCWLEYEHPYYAANKAKWAFALAHYTGEVVEADCVKQYLIRRAVGETEDAFLERCKLADYTNHFAEVVESLAGMGFAVEGDANRRFADENGVGLGDIKDPATVIGRLWRRADSDGNGYLTVYKRLAIFLSVTHTVWFMVDSVNDAPVLRVLSPLMVTNWSNGPDGPEVLVKESVDLRGSLQDAPTSATQYLQLTTKGWQRWKVSDTGDAVKLEGADASGEWKYVSPDEQDALPIFRVELPMIRPVGYQLARKANAIFNKESERDNLLRSANFPKLVIPAADETFDRTTGQIAEGANAIQEDPQNGGNTRYIAPPTDSASIATEVLKQKVAEFKATAHKAYDDGAGGGAQKTATEVRQDVGSGTGAFLQLLKSGLDDAENNALWRIEQVVYMNDRRKWFIAHVERSDDFMPADPDSVVEKSAAIAWGRDKPVPLGRTALVALAKEVARHRGAEFNEAELEAAVESRMLLDAMADSATAGITLPPEARVELLMKMLAAAGTIDAEAEVEMGDGSKAKLGDVIRASALSSMQAADEAKRREAEALAAATGGAPGGGTTDPNHSGF